MSLFDWIDLGADAKNAKDGGTNSFANKLASALPGSLVLSMGDDLEAYILGGSQLQVFGQYSQFTADIESMIAHLIPGMGGLFGALVNGTSGQSTFVYGKSADLTYGEDIEIKRAVSANATGNNYFSNWMTKGNAIFTASSLTEEGKPAATPQQTAVDNIVGPICGVLAAAQVLSALAFDLVIYLKYPEPNPTQQLQNELNKIATTPPKPGTNVYQELADSMDVPPGPAAMSELFQTLSYTIPSRIAAVLIELELIAQAARDANKDLYLGEILKKWAIWTSLDVLLKAIIIAGAVGTAADAVARGLKAAAAAIKKYAWVIGSIAFLIVSFGLIAVAIAGEAGKL